MFIIISRQHWLFQAKMSSINIEPKLTHFADDVFIYSIVCFFYLNPSGTCAYVSNWRYLCMFLRWNYAISPDSMLKVWMSVREKIIKPLRMSEWKQIPNTMEHDDVIKWKNFPRYWPFVRGIHRSLVNSPHKGQWRGVLMFSLICARINGSVNNDEAGYLRRHRSYYDVTAMNMKCQSPINIFSIKIVDTLFPKRWSIYSP